MSRNWQKDEENKEVSCMNVLYFTLNNLLSFALIVNITVWCDLIAKRGYEGTIGKYELMLIVAVLALILFILPEIMRLSCENFYDTYNKKTNAYWSIGLLGLFIDIVFHSHFGFEYYNMLAIYCDILYIIKCLQWQPEKYNRLEKWLFESVGDYLFNNKNKKNK